MAALGDVATRLQTVAALLAASSRVPIQLCDFNMAPLPDCSNADEKASLCDVWAKAAVVLDGNIVALQSDIGGLESAASKLGGENKRLALMKIRRAVNSWTDNKVVWVVCVCELSLGCRVRLA